MLLVADGCTWATSTGRPEGSGAVRTSQVEPRRSPPAVPAAHGAGPVSVGRCLGARPTLVGTPGDDVVVGTGDPDVIVTGAGDDVVTGLRDGDRVCAGAGDDRVRAPGSATVLVALGEGDDVLRVLAPRRTGRPALTPCADLTGAAGGVRVDLVSGEVDGQGRDRLVGVRCVRTGSHADEVVGSPYADHVRLGAGADVARAGGGADRVLGGPGSDRLLGQRGHDVLEGRTGADLLRGGAGDDVLRAGTRCSRSHRVGQPAVPDVHSNVVLGGPGDDRLTGDLGGDRLAGGAGRDGAQGGYWAMRADRFTGVEELFRTDCASADGPRLRRTSPY